MSNGFGTDRLDVEDVEHAQFAERDAIARDGGAFSASFQAASVEDAGTPRRDASAIGPVLVGAGLLAAAGLGIALVRSPAKRRRSPAWNPAASTEPWSNLLRAMAIAFAAAAGRRLAERWLARDETRTPPSEVPVPPTPDAPRAG
jgi:hypothetical protein